MRGHLPGIPFFTLFYVGLDNSDPDSVMIGGLVMGKTQCAICGVEREQGDKRKSQHDF